MTSSDDLVIITGTITAIAAILPQVANFIRQVRADRLAEESRQNIVSKVDDIHKATDGMTDKLVAVTARASFQNGVNAQAAVQDATHDVVKASERRIGDSPGIIVVPHKE
jgi:hypothetical protein